MAASRRTPLSTDIHLFGSYLFVLTSNAIRLGGCFGCLPRGAKQIGRRLGHAPNGVTGTGEARATDATAQETPAVSNDASPDIVRLGNSAIGTVRESGKRGTAHRRRSVFGHTYRSPSYPQGNVSR